MAGRGRQCALPAWIALTANLVGSQDGNVSSRELELPCQRPKGQRRPGTAVLAEAGGGSIPRVMR